MSDYVVQTWYNKGGDALFSGLPLRLPLKLPVALPVFQKPVVAVRESSFFFYLHGTDCMTLVFLYLRTV